MAKTTVCVQIFQWVSAISFYSNLYFLTKRICREKLVKKYVLKKNKFAAEIAFLLICRFAKLLRLMNVFSTYLGNVYIPVQNSAKHENFVRTLPVIEGDGVALGEASPQLAQHFLVPVLTEPDHLIHNTCTRHTSSHAKKVKFNVCSTFMSPNDFFPTWIKQNRLKIYINTRFQHILDAVCVKCFLDNPGT